MKVFRRRSYLQKTRYVQGAEHSSDFAHQPKPEDRHDLEISSSIVESV
jgi:hypothetical protein